MTFLCKTSWKNSIVFSKALTFRNHACLQNIKKKQLDTKTSLYIRIIYLVYVEFVLYLV